MMRVRAALAAAAVLAGAVPALAASLVAKADYPEGPVLIDGALWFAEMTANRVTRIDDGRSATFSMSEGCGPTSLSPLGETRIVVLCHLSGGLLLLTRDGQTAGSIRFDVDGAEITYPNDSHADGRGGVYLSSSGPFSPHAQPAGRLLHLSAAGAVRTVADGLAYPNGLFVAQDGTLYVSEHLGHRILRFRIEPDAALTPLADFAGPAALGLGHMDLDPFVGPDGIEVASDGTVHVAIYGAGKLLTFSSDGLLLGETEVATPFLTNVVLDEAHGRAFLVGAFSNRVWPYRGEVIEIAYPLTQRTEAD